MAGPTTVEAIFGSLAVQSLRKWQKTTSDTYIASKNEPALVFVLVTANEALVERGP